MKKLIGVVVFVFCFIFVATASAAELNVYSDTSVQIIGVYNKSKALGSDFVDLSSSPLSAVRAQEPKPYPTGYVSEGAEVTNSVWDTGVSWSFQTYAPGADWIWETERAEGPATVYAPDNSLYDPNASSNGRVIVFQKKFNIVGVPQSANLRITADNCYEVWVNGHQVARSATAIVDNWEETDLHEASCASSGWQTVGDYTILASDLINGENVLEIRAGNEFYHPTNASFEYNNSPVPPFRAEPYRQQNPGAMIFAMNVKYDDSQVCYVPGQSVFASKVESYRQGLQKNGGPVAAARSVPAQGLVYEAAKSESSFFSLGFGGWIIVSFDDIIVNGPGVNDIKITEDTWGGPYPLEKADVFVSQNGSDWIKIGEADNTKLNLIHTTTEFDLDSVGLAWAKYVKIVDTTDPNLFNSIPTGDGYDLNAVEALSPGYLGECEEEYDPLVVTKTANTSFTRTWEWTIDKTATEVGLTLAEGEQYSVGYTVAVDASKVDGTWVVSGVITINNPNDVAAEVTGVTDSLGEVVCPVTFPYTLVAGQNLECTYSGSLTDGSVRTNTATVTTSGDISGGSGTASVTFGDPSEVVDECVDVIDTLEGNLGEVCVGDGLPKVFKYQRMVGPYDYGVFTVDNTASFVTNDSEETGSDSWTIRVEVPKTGCTLTQGYWKTHSSYGKAPYDDNWANLTSSGANTPFDSSGMTWYQVFWTPPKGNVYYQLAHQYMAAVLNILNNASAPYSVKVALGVAEGLFDEYGPSDILGRKANDPVRKQFVSLAGTLERYNEGLIGPGHCDEQVLPQ